MRTQRALAIIAVVVLFSVLMVVPTVMSFSDDDYTYLRFTGTVTELWNQSHEGASWISASAVRDLDGDGKNDVIVNQCECDEAMNTTTATVIAKRGYDGTHLWMAESKGYIEVTTDVTEKPGSPGQSRAADFNGDGIANVLLVLTSVH